MKQLTIPVLVAMANQNAERIGGSMKAVRETIEHADVAVAIWQDFTRPTSIAILAIKGNAILRDAIANNVAFTGKVTAIRCIEEAQARALLQVCGQVERPH